MVNKTCCFTGHRPDKLYGYNLNTPEYATLFSRTTEVVRDLLENKGVRIFIVGGALGFDTLAFLVLYSLKSKYDIEIRVAIPFKNQDIKWFRGDRERFAEMLTLADKVIEVDKEKEYHISGIENEIYHPAKMQKRNEYMVDNSKYVIGCWDGSKGGTGNTIRYVEKLANKECIIIKP